MTFTPYIPSQGIAGWNFLQSTYDRQFEAFSQSGDLSNDTDYFLENIGAVQTSEDLLNDRRLLQVAVKAFGLQEEVDYRALLERVLNEGTTASDALANTLDDQRYVELSEAFGFGPGQSLKTADKGAMQSVVDAFNTSSFEEAIGEQDEVMRNALFAQRSFPELLGDTIQEEGSEGSLRDNAVSEFLARIGGDPEEEEDRTLEEKWQEMLNRDSLDEFFNTAFSLGNSVLTMDDDERIEAYMDSAEELLGTSDPAIFFAPENAANVTALFTAQARREGTMSTEDISAAAELSSRLLSAMVAEESAVNEVWSDLLDNTQSREFFEVALNVSDLSGIDSTAAIELVKRKAEDIFGTDDPREFATGSDRDATMEIFRTAAQDQGLSSGDISRSISVTSSIFNIVVPDEADANADAAVDAKWLAVMGQGVLPSFFETAFQLPNDFDEQPIDDQLAEYKNQGLALFGTNDPEEILNSFNTTNIFSIYRTNAEAEGELPSLVTYTEDLARGELEKLFPAEEEEDIDSLLENIFGDDEDQTSDIDTMWFTIMGQEALTDFMQAALGLPEEVGQMDIDIALDVYKNRAQQVLGSDDPSVFANSENMQGLIDRYLATSQIGGGAGGSSSNSAVLSLFR
ncbi:hypothetical protein TRM7557_02587 [Tritonibacter multivorans]|uniref:Flagellar protein n=1 Tax=Tritonibacter multivorans TaxID=928856 RepID=A0A0P1GET1_9RHOB|nr:DUF1217 domain-containing protein [Tritonibacter multivorans]MDA7420164.1 DUF1217 domain-containing protein [Tritonibacter multivorans]CUH79810.1 hypothetical protein TRM7557_02587 [Tritonibacter multivorans]SFC01944.1 Protein of unknown function [Tritonibacter multivorans]